MTYFNRASARAHEARRYVLTLACLGVLLHGSALSGAAAQSLLPPVDTFRFEGGEISVSPVQQMSVVIKTPAGIIYTDPIGGGRRYAGYPAPDIILISHEHHEHYDAETLADLVTPTTRILVPPYVMEQLPEHLRGNAVSLANGDGVDLGRIEVEAIGAYGISGQAKQWHPQWRGNGYVVTVEGRRLYVAGSTEATPEMLSLEDIYLAVLPLYPPYALNPQEAIRAVSAMQPVVTYIYQYNSVRTRDEFIRMSENSEITGSIIAHDIP